MIIDNILPKDYFHVDNPMSVLDFDLIVEVIYHGLQTKTFHLFKHEKFDSYIMVYVTHTSVHIRDFNSREELVDFVKNIKEYLII